MKPIRISARKLTAQECGHKAREMEYLLSVCVDPGQRRYLGRELRGWLRLAQERA